MLGVSCVLGITKLSTTVNHPEYNGMIERYNRTHKSIFHMHADKFGTQWDRLVYCGHTETRP